MVSGWLTPGRCSSCSPDNEILRQEMQRWQHYAGQVMFGLKDRLIVSHVARRRGREDGTKRVPGGQSGSRLGGTSARVKSLEVGRGSQGPLLSQLPGSWKLTCPWTKGHSRPHAQHQQHLMRQPRHNLHNCRTTWIQPNVPLRAAIITPRPTRQTPCDCHLLISFPTHHERIRQYHLEASQVA